MTALDAELALTAIRTGAVVLLLAVKEQLRVALADWLLPIGGSDGLLLGTFRPTDCSEDGGG